MIKRWLILANYSLVNMDAFTQTNNAAVTLLSGKYSYLDILWNRCTSYRNESGWVKSSLQSFVLFRWHFFLSFYFIAWHIMRMLLCSRVRWLTEFKIKLHFIKNPCPCVWEQTLVSLKILHIVQPTFYQRWVIPSKSHSNDELGVW